MWANNIDIFASLRHYRSDYLPDDDISFVRERYASADPRGRIYLGPNNGPWRNINSVASSPASNGWTICMKSASTNDVGEGGTVDHDAGVMCAEVDDNIDYYASNSTTQRWTQMEFDVGDPTPAGGSSGGPWYFGHTAYGTHTGHVTAGGVFYGFYQRIETSLPSLEAAHGGDFRLYCGGTSEFTCEP